MPAPIKADELFTAWSRSTWRSVYLFAGQEDFLIEQAVVQAASHWLKDDPSGMNRDRFDGDTHEAEEILEGLRTVPFLASTRLVQITNAHELSAAGQRLLAEELPKLSADTKVLFIWGKAWERDDAKKPLVDAISETGQVVIFWPLFPEAAQRWVLQRAKIYKKSLAPEAAAWLVEHAGESLRLLDQELAKASLFVGERPEIALEDLQDSFGYQRASSPFEWLNALRGRHSREAIRILEELLREGEAAPMLLALLARQIRDWLGAKHNPAGAGNMGFRYGVRRGDENRFAQDMNRWTEEELTAALTDCLLADQAIKTGKETPDMAMTLLTLRLCGLQPAHALR